MTEAIEKHFVIDSMLGKLAKWLRILGFDARYELLKNKEQIDAYRRQGFFYHPKSKVVRPKPGILPHGKQSPRTVAGGYTPGVHCAAGNAAAAALYPLQRPAPGNSSRGGLWARSGLRIRDAYLISPMPCLPEDLLAGQSPKTDGTTAAA